MIARRWPELMAALLFLAAGVLLSRTMIHFDMTWQLWVTRQMLGGATLYRDVIETNPPLWFWMALPVEMLIERFQLPPAATILSANIIWMGFGLALFGFFIRDLAPRRRAELLLAALVAVLLLPLKDFAQRENLALAGALPYAALIASRRMNTKVSWQAALVTGAYAAVGFAFKHYFILVPLALEAWLLFAQRRAWHPFRPETIALAVLAVAYGAAIFLITPQYLTEMLPQLRAGYAPASLIDMFKEPIPLMFMGMWALGLAVLWVYRKQQGTLAQALTIAAVMFMLAYLIQARGWSYHATPGSGALFVALFAVLPGPRWRWLLVAAAALPMVGLAIARGPVRDKFSPPIAQALQGLPPGTAVMSITDHAERDWPAVINLHMRWPSRYYDYWMVPALEAYRVEHHGLDASRQALADKVRAATVTDLSCNQPEVILTDSVSSPDAFAFLMEDPQFSAFMSGYTKAADVEGWHVWRRTSQAQSGACFHFR